MGLIEWAEREVRLACEHEAENAGNPGDEVYGQMCCKAALELLKTLAGQGHSGFSASVSVGIFNKLARLRPLTPLTNNPEDWKPCSYHDDRIRSYQHVRDSELFKDIYPGGLVRYYHTGMYEFRELGSRIPYYTRLPDELRKYLPEIVFPYMPQEKPYVFYTKEWLTDRKNGDFDTRAFLSVESPDGTVQPIHLYYGEVNGEWMQITQEEYTKRVRMHKEREKREQDKLP